MVGITFVNDLISALLIFIQTPWSQATGLGWFCVAFGLIVTAIMLGNLIFIYFGNRFDRVIFAGKHRSYSHRKELAPSVMQIALHCPSCREKLCACHSLVLAIVVVTIVVIHLFAKARAN